MGSERRCGVMKAMKLQVILSVFSGKEAKSFLDFRNVTSIIVVVIEVVSSYVTKIIGYEGYESFSSNTPFFQKTDSETPNLSYRYQIYESERVD
jgi:hypothetical protein